MHVLWIIVSVRISFPFFRMFNAFLLNIFWHPASHIFPMDINVMFDNPVRVFPLQAATGGFGNVSLNAMDDFMLPHWVVPLLWLEPYIMLFS